MRFLSFTARNSVSSKRCIYFFALVPLEWTIFTMVSHERVVNRDPKAALIAGEMLRLPSSSLNQPKTSAPRSPTTAAPAS